MLYYETSALENKGIMELFEGVAKELLKRPKKSKEKSLGTKELKKEELFPKCAC